jgi:hypothetical protein
VLVETMFTLAVDGRTNRNPFPRLRSVSSGTRYRVAADVGTGVS